MKRTVLAGGFLAVVAASGSVAIASSNGIQPNGIQPNAIVPSNGPMPNGIYGNGIRPNGSEAHFISLQAVKLVLPDGSEVSFR
jgi:hypothetical protein